MLVYNYYFRPLDRHRPTIWPYPRPFPNQWGLIKNYFFWLKKVWVSLTFVIETIGLVHQHNSHIDNEIRIHDLLWKSKVCSYRVNRFVLINKKLLKNPKRIIRVGWLISYTLTYMRGGNLHAYKMLMCGIRGIIP